MKADREKGDPPEDASKPAEDQGNDVSYEVHPPHMPPGHTYIKPEKSEPIKGEVVIRTDGRPLDLVLNKHDIERASTPGTFNQAPKGSRFYTPHNDRDPPSPQVKGETNPATPGTANEQFRRNWPFANSIARQYNASFTAEQAGTFAQSGRTRYNIKFFKQGVLIATHKGMMQSTPKGESMICFRTPYSSDEIPNPDQGDHQNPQEDDDQDMVPTWVGTQPDPCQATPPRPLTTPQMEMRAERKIERPSFSPVPQNMGNQSSGGTQKTPHQMPPPDLFVRMMGAVAEEWGENMRAGKHPNQRSGDEVEGTLGEIVRLGIHAACAKMGASGQAIPIDPDTLFASANRKGIIREWIMAELHR